GTEGVEAFPSRPLSVLALEVARRDVIDARVAKNILFGFGCRNVASPGPNDDSELSLEVDILRNRRIHDGIAGGDQRRGWLEENQRLSRYLIAQFLRVILIVPAYAYNLGRRTGNE